MIGHWYTLLLAPLDQEQPPQVVAADPINGSPSISRKTRRRVVSVGLLEPEEMRAARQQQAQLRQRAARQLRQVALLRALGVC